MALTERAIELCRADAETKKTIVSSRSRSHVMQEKETPFWERLYSRIEAIDKIVDKVCPIFLYGVLLYLLFHINLWIWRDMLWQFPSTTRL